MSRDVGHYHDLLIDFARISSARPVCLGLEVNGAVDVLGRHFGSHLEEGWEPVAEKSTDRGQAGANHRDTYFDYGPVRWCDVVPWVRVSLGIHDGCDALHVASFELPNETMNFSRIMLVTQALDDEH